MNSLTPQSPVTRQHLSHSIKDAVEKAAFSGAGSLDLNTLESQFAPFVLYISDLCDANPGRLLVSLYLSMSVWWTHPQVRFSLLLFFINFEVSVIVRLSIAVVISVLSDSTFFLNFEKKNITYLRQLFTVTVSHIDSVWSDRNSSFFFFLNTILFFSIQISPSHVNNFTGTVYQSVLLSQKQHGRTFSMEESVQPNTSPAQWPGTVAEVKIQKVFCLWFEE